MEEETNAKVCTSIKWLISCKFIAVSGIKINIKCALSMKCGANMSLEIHSILCYVCPAYNDKANNAVFIVIYM